MLHFALIGLGLWLAADLGFVVLMVWIRGYRSIETEFDPVSTQSP